MEIHVYIDCFRTNKLFINRLYACINRFNCIIAAVDGAIDTILIKTAGFWWCKRTYKCCNTRRWFFWCVQSPYHKAGGARSYSYNCCESGYTFAYIRNADIVSAATSLSGAELDVIIPPKGHGANAVEELGGIL